MGIQDFMENQNLLVSMLPLSSLGNVSHMHLELLIKYEKI
jgi:hypothetical protein